MAVSCRHEVSEGAQKAPWLADSGATQVALARARPLRLSNSAAMLGADKGTAKRRLQLLMVEQHGCSLLVPMGLAEIEIEGVEENAAQLEGVEARGGRRGWGEAAELQR